MSQPLIMSFRPDAAAMCLGWRKTMTRRIAKSDYWIQVWAADNASCTWVPADGYTAAIRRNFPHLMAVAAQAISTDGDSFRVLWRVGETAAIKPGRNAALVGRVLVTELRTEHVQDITEDDAIREGAQEMADGMWTMGSRALHSSAREAFSAVWRCLYPRGPNSWEANPHVIVIGFEPTGEET